MEISVIIPTYNRASKVTRALNSVLNQTYPPQEVIVVDDGSIDETQLLLKKYEEKGVKVIKQSHQGVAAARNRGIKAAQGEWLAFLDSDDWWLPKKLENQIAFHKQFPKILVTQTKEIWLREEGKRVNPKKYHQKPSGWIFEKCLERCLISPSAVLISAQVFEKVGLFDEELPACEDYDLWLRVSLLFEVGLVKEELVVKTGGHSDQLSTQVWGLDRFRVKALEKILKYPLKKEPQKAVLKTLVTKLKILEQGSKKRGFLERAKLYQQKLEKYETFKNS